MAEQSVQVSEEIQLLRLRWDVKFLTCFECGWAKAFSGG